MYSHAGHNQQFFKITSFGLHPDRLQNYTLSRTYEKNIL